MSNLRRKSKKPFILKAFLPLALSCFTFAAANPTNREIFAEERLKPLAQVEALAVAPIEQLCEVLDVKHLIDAGCGTPLWQSGLSKNILYTGVDIVGSDAPFLSLDITEDPLPKGDLLLCRECLTYFSYRDIFAALENFKASGSAYLCATTFPSLQQNRETSTGIRRPLNLEAAPFSFPTPLILISEGEGRCLAVWKLEDLDLSPLSRCVFPPLTVLSKPVGGPQGWEHSAVMNSMRRGLSKVHRDYNVNPDKVAAVKENVLVLANIDAGLQAYRWKQQKKIATLLLGPNIVGYVTECDSFTSWPLIDAYLINSEWPMKNFLRFNPALGRHMRPWYSGVDENMWKPSCPFSQKNSQIVLLYRKNNEDISDRVQQCLERLGYQVISLTYGHYTHEQLKQALEAAKFAVFVSRSESQGIALAEAWSMDVPVLAWNPKGSVSYLGYEYLDVSSCPYMNPWVGKEWVQVEELEEMVAHFSEISAEFQSRRWVLLHMTDKVSVEQLLVQLRGVQKQGEL